MPTKILVQAQDGTPPQIAFRDSTDFSPTAANDLRRSSPADTEVQLDLTSVADAAARQSTKVDLSSDRAPAYSVRAALEWAGASGPTAGEVVQFFWAPSQSATAGTGNAAGVSGSDSAYTGDNSNLADAIKQLDFIGNFICTSLDGVQIAEVGMLVPRERYGSLIVKNESGAGFIGDAVEMHVVFDPIVPESQ